MKNVILLLIVVTVGMVSCGSPNVSGEYKAAVELDKSQLGDDDSANMIVGMMALANITFQFNDGSGLMKMNMGAFAKEEPITYTIDGNTLNMNIDGKETPYDIISDDLIIGSNDGVKITLTKIK